MITHKEIIGLLVSCIYDTLAFDLVKKCEDLGMRAVPYQPVVMDSNLPAFERGYHFRFNPDGKEGALFEILEKDGLVLQAGYQLVFPSSLSFIKVKKRYYYIKEILETHYGVGQPMNIAGAKSINYGNNTTIAYISRVKSAGRDAITVRVGNRRFWN